MTRRLVASYLGIALFVLLALELPLGVQNQRNERHDVEIKVERDATVLSSYAEDAVQTQNRAELAAVARYAYSYATSAGTRVVIVDRRGYALIDTSSRVPGTELFASRPEIARALAGKIAAGTRHSATLGTNLLYVAVPVGSGGAVTGAVRITYPMTSVESRILHYWLLLGGIALTVLAAAAIVGVRLARLVSRPLRRLEHAAAAFGRGDLRTRASETDGPPEVRSLATAFNGTAAKLEQLFHSQQEFIADASHELRTPLTALRLRLETLTGDADHKSVTAALHEVERLTSMVESMLALARADATQDSAVRLDVTALAYERADTWNRLATERGLSLLVDAKGPALATAGPARVTQVLDNLLSNALRHAPPGTEVTVSAAADAQWVSLHVRDRGPGLSEEQRARAFDRFWRGGWAQDGSGSGLGLAIVRRLVEADGGTVELTAAQGGGTDVLVRLRADRGSR